MALINLTGDAFNATVDTDDIIILDFWANWCGPCKMFGPVFEAAAAKHPDITFAKIDTEAEHDLAAHFNIRSIPTLMVLKNRTLVFNQAGAMSAGQFEQLIAAVRELDVAAELARQEAGQG
ncbi:thioredoxin [Crenobacter luteus]|uniref:Thioredoxin n=1 Tax=Crenobacter luteus TaxID=1452487 RepID=A0A165FCC9_9NEIS|nr:thioredoxin [Crenobacter luteus]KZE32795.1 thioredoxin [Crenobacter luteus]TCP14921.1 thioredoxin [Crenobacter luteus]